MKIPCEEGDGIDAEFAFRCPDCDWSRDSGALPQGAAGCTKAASNDLFLAKSGWYVYSVGHRTFEACVGSVRAACIPFVSWLGRRCMADTAFDASSIRPFGAEVLVELVATGRIVGGGPCEAEFPGFPSRPVIHVLCAPPRKCWVVEFEEMKWLRVVP